MDMRELSAEATAWKLLADACKEKADAARGRLDLAMEQSGALKADVKIGGASWGTVSRTGGGKVGRVTDLAALIAWTREHRPENLVQALNPSWVRYLEEMMTKMGACADPTTGEVIPGVSLVDQATGIRVTPNADARRGARDLVDQMSVGALMLPAEGDELGV